MPMATPNVIHSFKLLSLRLSDTQVEHGQTIALLASKSIQHIFTTEVLSARIPCNVCFPVYFCEDIPVYTPDSTVHTTGLSARQCPGTLLSQSRRKTSEDYRWWEPRQKYLSW